MKKILSAIGLAVLFALPGSSANAQTCLQAGCSPACGPGYIMIVGNCLHVTDNGDKCMSDSFRAPLPGAPRPVGTACTATNDEGESFIGVVGHDEPPNEDTTSQQPQTGTAEFPFAAQSWGGIVRSGPGQQYRRDTSLREGEPIVILERSGEQFQGLPWFKISYRGRIGYHWGGIICPKGQPIAGTFEVC